MPHEDEALEQGLHELTTTDDPVRALVAHDARRARREYPLTVLAGPMFGVAEELGGDWRVITLGEATPQCSRDDLAGHLRLEARAAAEPEPYLAAARVLDWERYDELVVAGRRFRIIRVEQILRLNLSGEPEPPRPTDPDPRTAPAPRYETLGPSGRAGHPEAECAELAVRFAEAVEQPGAPNEQARSDARRAARSHPVPIPMLPAFSVAEYLHDGWRSSTAACPTPQRAREALAEYLQQVAPVVERVDEPTRTAYDRAAARLLAGRLDALEVCGRRFRIIRVEKAARFGEDGPEPPRPSDFDPDPPVEVLALRLRAEGVIED
ncbi:DUF5954 family protein [Actinocorallia populi]|uniref:DUF5954 family protein n=1 Tax=Actinocorallia populi TaxID=2079200 RepID=UPI0013006E2E|nr:DUF5954 family protein [Actinocorallia populi]